MIAIEHLLFNSDTEQSGVNDDVPMAQCGFGRIDRPNQFDCKKGINISIRNCLCLKSF
ncbi:MAG: hypothetical protein JWP89_4423 [Schlesneria sp.]|nr:hypothetical protein [Schlesneria sp.]